MTSISNFRALTIVFILFFSFTCTQSKIDSAENVAGSKKVFPFGLIQAINSSELTEERILNIYLPQGYHQDSTNSYPVVYVLDGSAHEDFPHIAGLVQFMNMYDIIPKSIVVGIANVDRYRDFTHFTNEKEDLKRLPTGGGSAKFIQFLENELLPFVTKEYHTNGHNTIIGQSMGGLLVAEIVLEKIHLFDDYIAVSPSLWWDNQSLVNSAEGKLASQNLKGKKVFLSLGTEPDVMHQTADKLAKAISEAKDGELKIFYEPLLEEDHATILHRAAYLAFERLNE